MGPSVRAATASSIAAAMHFMGNRHARQTPGAALTCVQLGRHIAEHVVQDDRQQRRAAGVPQVRELPQVRVLRPRAPASSS